jgi:hypothetical protein
MNFLNKLFNSKESYDKDSQQVIENLRFLESEINQIDDMKKSEGWKVLEKKLREELHEQILNKVKDDPKVMTILSLLQVADTKSQVARLEQEINSLIPE